MTCNLRHAMGLCHPVYVNHLNKYTYIHTGVLANKTNKIHIRIQNACGLLLVHHILYKHTYTHARTQTYTDRLKIKLTFSFAMCVASCVYIILCIRTHTHTHAHARTHTHTHAHTHTHIQRSIENKTSIRFCHVRGFLRAHHYTHVRFCNVRGLLRGC